MPARALAYDDHRDGLWVTGHDSIRFVAQGVTETEIGVANPRGAWPLPTGLLVEGQLGKWTHHDEFGEVTSRVLPSALSWWRNGDVVQWLGPRHPRHPGPVLVSTDAQHPLLAPEVSPVDTRDGDVRAAPTAGGDVVFAKAEGGHLHLEIHDARWRLPIAGEGLDSFIWLGDDRYVVTTQAPELVFQLELESHDIHELDGLRGPLAGPVPCPFMNSLP